MKEEEKTKIIILENNGRIKSLIHNILLMKSQIKALREQNKELKNSLK